MSVEKVKELKKMLSKRELRNANTYCLYSIKWKNKDGFDYWTPPFLAPSDEMALSSLVELSKVHPELQNRYLFCVATWCALDCKFKNYTNPRLVVKKEKK